MNFIRDLDFTEKEGKTKSVFLRAVEKERAPEIKLLEIIKKNEKYKSEKFQIDKFYQDFLKNHGHLLEVFKTSTMFIFYWNYYNHL